MILSYINHGLLLKYEVFCLFKGGISAEMLITLSFPGNDNSLIYSIEVALKEE